MTGRNPERGTAPRDFTGQERERLARENRDAQREAAERMSMVTAAVAATEEIPVDLTPEALAAAEALAAQEPEPVVLASDSGGRPVIEMLPDPPQLRRVRSLEPGDLLEPVVVTMADDYEQVTVGARTILDENGKYLTTILDHFDFKAGKRYRVPRWVAQHFEEKEMTR